MIVEPTEEALARAASIIRRGGLVAFPTETVYGLGANALDPQAVARIYEVKQRPFASPLIVHVGSIKAARALTLEWPALAETLARHFWPGPLTLVLKKAPSVPDLVTAGLDTVGVRMPQNPVALALLKHAEVPIAAPSANPFTGISPTAAEHVQRGLGDKVDLILDGGPAQVGIESTVVSVCRRPPAILRPGMISQDQLAAVTGFVWEREVNLPEITESAPSPGLHPRHYAPRTPFHVLEPGAPLPSGRGRILQMPSDRIAYAAALYTELHKADTENLDWIAVMKPPETAEWAGILDRLQRASAPVD